MQTTWTAIEPRSERIPRSEFFRSYRGTVWRVVESQNRISTDRLVDDDDDREVLEALIEEAKPEMPEAAKALPRLLGTPFRYGYEVASRFRRAHERPGIFYASEAEITAVAEVAFHRLKFLSRSPDALAPRTIIEHSSFCVSIALERMLDLTEPPYASRRTSWTDPVDYSECQDFGAAARAIGCGAVRYESVRDKGHRANIALFEAGAFDAASFRVARSWHFRFERDRLSAYAAYPSPEHFVFTFEEFGLEAR